MKRPAISRGPPPFPSPSSGLSVSPVSHLFRRAGAEDPDDDVDDEPDDRDPDRKEQQAAKQAEQNAEDSKNEFQREQAEDGEQSDGENGAKHGGDLPKGIVRRLSDLRARKEGGFSRAS